MKQIPIYVIIVLNKLLQKSIALIFMLSVSSHVFAAVSAPANLAVIGFDGDAWNIYLAQDGSLRKVDQIPDPRSFSFHPSSETIAYIGSDSHLYLHDIKSGNTEKLSDDANSLRFTQAFFSRSGKELYIVQLPEGKSRRTEIVAISVVDKQKRYLVRKRTAQFEPYTRDDDHLYYSTAICVDDCEGMIWELWRRDSTTAKQVQLTLLNHVSNQPHLSADNWLYFSSNAPDGYFHIWRMRPEVGAKPEQLTFEQTRDSEPFTDSDNNLYFIRKSPQSTNIMLLSNGEAIPVATSETLTDFRNLEVR